MATEELMSLREATCEAVSRLQDFDSSNLPQEKRLGTENNFDDAIEPAENLIGVYKQLPIEVINLLPEQVLQSIKSQADADFNRLTEILDFQLEEGNVTNRIDSLINGLEASYGPAFMTLHQWISYSVRRTTDITRLEQELRATIQTIRDETQNSRDELDTTKNSAMAVLEDVRKVAEEQGVSQQASYFKKATTEHDTSAHTWLKTTIWLSISLGLYAMGSVFVHKWSWLTPATTYETVQLAISKILVFAVLSYMLVWSARNYRAQKHNAIINKHRQDALMTYEALVNAGKDATNRDIVLIHASECIFEPKPTGFARGEGSDFSAAKSLVGVVASGANATAT